MRTKADLAFSLAVLALLGWMVWQATGWQITASLFPLTVGVPAVALAAWQVGAAARRTVRGQAAVAGDGGPHLASPIAMGEEHMARRRTLEMTGWIVVFTVAVVALGFRVSAALLPFLFMKVAAKERWLPSILLGLGTYAAFVGLFVAGLHLVLPPGALADALGWESPDSYLIGLFTGR